VDGSRAGAVLSKALVRASARLGLTSQKELAEILGVSAPTVSRLLRGARPLDPDSNEGQRATLFLRIWRSLDALVGGDDSAATAWFHAANHHLGARPVELARKIDGLVHVADYLDAMRGKV
jgi:DNA-directed RNA polymerase specialized sigma24 family protein